MASLSAVSSNSKCVKCGTTGKSGALSCCARGGSWFNKCGDTGDTEFDHTWADGIHACRNFATLTSVQSPLQVTLDDEGVILHQLGTQSPNDTRQHTRSFSRDSVTNVGTANFTYHVRLIKVAVYLCVLLII